MDFSNKNRSPNSARSDSQRRNSQSFLRVPHESNENSFTPNKISNSVTPISRNEPNGLKSPFTSPLSQKRILTERNLLSESFKKSSPQNKTDKAISISVKGSRPDSPYPVPYDPVTNYTSPRPEFLRYDPNRRMEIMLRIEKAILDEEGGISPCTSSISTSPQLSAGNSVPEEEPSPPSTCSITIAPQKQELVNVEEDCLIDEEIEQEEGISYGKLALKLVFFLACLVSSVCYICSMSSNVEMKSQARISDVSVLGKMIGLSKMCSSRRNAEFTCGIEEWEVATEEAIPKEFVVSGLTFGEENMFSGGDLTDFTPQKAEMFSGGVMDVTTEGVETDIGLLAQGEIVDLPEVELPIDEDTQIFKRSETLKLQVYLLYSMQALACLSLLVALIDCLRKHISKRFYRKKKQNQATETGAQKGSGAVKKSTDIMSTPVSGNSEMHVIQTSEVDLLVESSVTDVTTVNEGSAKEVQLQATPSTTTPEALVEKIKKNTNERESTNTGVTPLRRSSRLRNRVTSP